jgi:hypothetical protein
MSATAKRGSSTQKIAQPEASEAAGDKRAKRSATTTTTKSPILTTKKSTTTTTHARYDKIHRTLLQVLMARKTLTTSEYENALDLIAKETGDKVTSLGTAITSINAMLNDESAGAFHLTIRSRLAVEENSLEYVYALVNTRQDAISKLWTSMESWHLAMFKTTLRLVAQADDGYCTHTDVVHAFKDEGKKAADINMVLQKLVALGWLDAHAEEPNCFTAGRRTLLELSDTMRELGCVECPLLHVPVVRTPGYKAWLGKKQAEVGAAA